MSSPTPGEVSARFQGSIPWDETGLLVVFDYETSGLHRDDGAKPATLGLKWSDNDQMVIPVDQGMLNKPDTSPTLFGDAPNVDIETWQHIHHWMAKQHLIAHGAKADLWFAWSGLRRFPEIRFDFGPSIYWDTLVTESLLEPNIRVSLDLVAERYRWNEPYRDADRAMRTWTKKNKIGGEVRYDLAPWEILRPYLEADLERTWKLFHHQANRIAQGELGWELFQRERDMVGVLFRMEQQGLPYRVQESIKAGYDAAAEMKQLETKMPFDPSTKKSVGDHFSACGLQMYFTEKGQYQLDQPTILRAIDHQIPGAVEYQRWSKLQTAKGLWYHGWAEKAGEDGRIRANYQQVKTWEGNNSAGTVSGRFAVSRVQVQAIPNRYQIPDGYPAMQDLVCPELPNMLYEIDISQAEMRTAASVSECEPMLEGFRQGFDAHDQTTRLIWEIEKDAEEWDQRRAVAKRLGFGVIYGAGIRTLAAQILQFTGQDLGEDGVRELWDRYRQQFPQLFRYSKLVERQAEKHRFLVLPGGKIRRFAPQESTYKSFNAMIQGGVAAAMSQAMIEIDRETPRIMVGQVHDSVLVETADISQVYLAAGIVQNTFETWFSGCPYPVDVKAYQDK